jgi:hypothetical protein
VNGFETEELREAQIKALLRELEAAERDGNEELAEAVRKSLRAFGHEAKTPARRAEKRPAARKVEKR